MKKFNIILFLAALVSFSACKDNEVDPNDKGALRIELEHTFGTSPLALGTTYTTSQDEELSLTTFKYYVSNVVLTKTDNSTWAQPESYYLVDASSPASTMLEISDVPVGDYKSVTFTIGVDSLRNVSGAQTGALSTENGMFWSWNSGYIFFKAEGASPQAMDGNFVYHVGGFSGANNALRTVTLNFDGSQAEVRKDAVPQVHVGVDAAQAFNSAPALLIANTAMIHMPGAAASEMATRYQNMFEFEHIHN